LSTPFYDQGSTHVFSDWLATSVLGIGVDDLAEFYVGVLPDLSDLLERETGNIGLQAEFLSRALKKLQPFGKSLSKAIRGKVFVDLGSGRSELSVMPRLFAQVFGAQKYIGVDICHERDFAFDHEFPNLGSFRSEFVKSDFVTYLAQLKISEPLMVSLFGIEVRDEIEESEKIRNDLADRLANILKPNDNLLLGAGTTDLYVSMKAFKKIDSDFYNFLFRRLP